MRRVTSFQNISAYACILIIIPLVAAILAAQVLRGTELKYLAGISLGMVLYAVAMAAILYAVFRKQEEGILARGLMAGFLYGFVDASLASATNGIPVFYEILSMPLQVASSLGMNPQNMIARTLVFVFFWTVIFGLVGSILRSQRKRSA